MFDSLTIKDTRPIVWLKRVFVFVIVAFLAVEIMAGYRSYAQVRDLELNAPRALSAGSVIKTAVVTSGRTFVDVEVDLIQGSHSERLLLLQVTKNKLGFFDPRTRHASESVTLPQEILSRFQPGRARLRAVATGGLKWTILKPPTVREIDVEISH